MAACSRIRSQGLFSSFILGLAPPFPLSTPWRLDKQHFPHITSRLLSPLEMSSVSPANDSHDLNDISATLLSSNVYLLIYAIPLLVLSAILTFSGSFLTLDRTRALPRAKTFDPENLSRRLRSWFVLEGGVGGVILGYAFGGV